MKKSGILTFLFVLLWTLASAQNKKEQIEALKFSLDSLTKINQSIKLAYHDSLSIERSQVIQHKTEMAIRKEEMENTLLRVKELEKELDKSKQALKDYQSRILSLENTISDKQDSIKLLFTQVPIFHIVNDSIKITSGENYGEAVYFKRISIPSNVQLENKINEMIFCLHNLNFNGYKCDANGGYNSYLSKTPLSFNKINNKQINYFASYNILLQDNSNFSLLIYDESYNLIWYDFKILEKVDSYDFSFNRRFLDDPEREH